MNRMKELSVLGLQPDILQHVCNIYLQYMLEECSAKKKKISSPFRKLHQTLMLLEAVISKLGYTPESTDY